MPIRVTDVGVKLSEAEEKKREKMALFAANRFLPINRPSSGTYPAKLTSKTIAANRVQM
jgi:hypothetical protein